MTARGSRDHPVATTPETVPSGCQWFTDPDGTLCLAPSCMARIQDPDAECLCDTLTARYDRLARKMQELQERQAYADTWWRSLREALDAHPDGRAILADAGKRAGR
ncbi:hypothetical protein [Streptomyces sp. NBC_01708]|uniref:hypothetical protein n=1 Tax=Streptomyces sp. NBC_01708 TaxID=2975915 RepID=UPI002E3439D8|nr:hypothetical protein [Streptomyces sp. NBC_01708]